MTVTCTTWGTQIFIQLPFKVCGLNKAQLVVAKNNNISLRDVYLWWYSTMVAIHETPSNFLYNLMKCRTDWVEKVKRTVRKSRLLNFYVLKKCWQISQIKLEEKICLKLMTCWFSHIYKQNETELVAGHNVLADGWSHYGSAESSKNKMDWYWSVFV